MKTCPNLECPYRVQNGVPAEYMDAIETCHDCGSLLVDAGKDEATSPSESAIPKRLWRKIGVTLSVPVAVHLITWIRIPGVRPSPDVESAFGDTLSVLSLGISPILTAYVLVEIAAAVVSRWRRLRIGGPVGRGKLTRSATLTALILALIQSYGVISYLQSLDELDNYITFTLPAIVPMLSIVCGTGLLIVIFRIVDRYGLGNGLCVLILYDYGMRVLYSLVSFINNRGLDSVGRQNGDVLISVLLLVGLVVATRYVLKSDWKKQTLPKKVDIITGLFFLILVLNWSTMSETLNGVFAGQAWMVKLAVLSIVLIVPGYLSKKLSSHPVRIASVIEDCGEDPNAVLVSGAKAQQVLRTAWIRSLAYLALLIVTWYWTKSKGGYLGQLVESDFCFYLIVSTAIVLDIIGDFRNHLVQDNLQSVWPIERLYVLGPALRLLERNGIKAYPKSAHTKTLLQFSGPFVPIELMVDAKDRKSAQEILYNALIRKSRDEIFNSAEGK